MEYIYWAVTWLCHRKCAHCYEDRFRPYYGDELTRVVDEARACFPKVIENLPDRITYFDINDPGPDGRLTEKRGRIGISGGEVLLKQVREPVLYRALDMLHDKYKNVGGIDLAVQTTGDLLTHRIIDELLEHHVCRITVAGLDDYHEGFEGQEAQDRQREKLTKMFESHGMRHWEWIQSQGRLSPEGRTKPGPAFSFFGATPGSWIGELWPRGRAHQNELSSATLKDNFCNRPAGGIDFLQSKHSGSKVAIEPNGNVYPCCIKSKKPLGNLTVEKLDDILERHVGNPIYEAISMGHPERMGIAHGWSVEKFLERSTITLPSGRIYQNLCIGCDSFHDEMLLPASSLVNIS